MIFDRLAPLVSDEDPCLVPAAGAAATLPKVLYKHNTRGASLGVIPDCVDLVLEHLGEELPDVPSWRHVEVVHLDLVRDFHGLQDVSGTLEAISRRHVPRGGRHQQEHAQDGRLVYFLKGFSRSWKTRGYDKAHQLGDVARHRFGDRHLYSSWAAASSGRMRFELELARDLLMKKGLNYVDELQDKKALRTLAEDYFDHVNFSAVTGAAAPLRKLLEDLRAQEKLAVERNLVVYLAYQALGADPPLSRHTKSRARSLARKYSLSGDALTAAGEPRRLDFDAGVELVGDDALRTLDVEAAS